MDLLPSFGRGNAAAPRRGDLRTRHASLAHEEAPTGLDRVGVAGDPGIRVAIAWSEPRPPGCRDVVTRGAVGRGLPHGVVEVGRWAEGRGVGDGTLRVQVQALAQHGG